MKANVAPALQETTEEKVPLHALIPAKVLAALAPVIRNVETMAHSTEAFITQQNILCMGTYLLPVSEGAVLVAVDSFRMVAVYDPKAFTSEPCKLWFPEALLQAAAEKTVELYDVNGEPLTIPMRPRPGLVHIYTLSGQSGLAILGLHEDDRNFAWLPGFDAEEWDEETPPVLGSWSDRSRGNVIDLTGFRVEHANPRYIQHIRSGLTESVGSATTRLRVNPPLLQDIMACAEILGVLPVSVYLSGEHGRVMVRSDESESLLAIVMPCRPSETPMDVPFTWQRELSADLTMEG